MPRFRYECFCRLNYDDELTYEELLECERELTEALHDLFERFGASHVDFFPDGDSLHAHCVFAALRADDLDRLVRDTAAAAGKRAEARFLLVDRQLEKMFLGLAAHGTGRAFRLDLPAPDGGTEKTRARILLE